MDAIRIDYAGMNAGVILAWLLIATTAGLIARMAARGRRLMGLWGDMAIGLVGIFAVGTLFRAFHSTPLCHRLHRTCRVAATLPTE